MDAMQTPRHGRLALALTVALCLSTAVLTGQSPAPAEPPTARRVKPDARKARKAYEKGLRLEQAADWPRAFEAYGEAARYAPADVEYALRRELARFRLVERHTDQAERAALAGRPDQAAAELKSALEKDPGYSVARERLAQLAPLVEKHKQAAAGYATAPPRVQPQAGTRDFDFRGDTRGAYEEVANKFGLKALFDGDMPSRPVRLRISGVDFSTAMQLVALQTDSFWRAMDAHSLFVAENTPQKRKDYAPQVTRTVPLSNATSVDRMTEITRLVREIVGITRTDLDTRSRTLTLRDTPENVAVAMALIEELEQAPAELMLEVELLELDRNKAQQLGISPPTTGRVFTLSPQAITEALGSFEGLQRVIQRVFGSTTIGTGNLLPPFIVFGGGQTRFLATLPGAAADFSETFSLVRNARRVLMRAQDSQPATFFVGDRFPISLAVLSPSLTLTPALLVNTSGVIARFDFATGDNPVSVVEADFSGDNVADLAVANQGSAATIASSSGAVRAANVVTITTTSPHGLGTGQSVTISGVSDSSFNGTFTIAAVPSKTTFTYAQTDPDATSGGGIVSTGNVSILLGTGIGFFGTKTDFATGTQPRAVATGDFNINNDNKRDLAVANSADNTVSILLGNGDGTFGPRTDFPTGTTPDSIAVGDFSIPADGKLDLAIANQQGKLNPLDPDEVGNTVSILLGNGNGTFGAKTDFSVGRSPVAVITRDFNVDGRLDLAVVNQQDNTVSILLGNGTGGFGPKTDFPTGNGPSAIDAGDLSADGILDLAVANQLANTVSILKGNGDGTFGPKTDFATGAAPSAVAAGNFSGDAPLDLVVTNRDSNNFSIFIGIGDGTLGPRFDLGTGNAPVSLTVADFSNDGRIDLATANSGSDTVSVILNPAATAALAAQFSQQTPFPASEYIDLGLKVNATPRIHNDGEVTLQMEFEIRRLAGTAFNGIPIISNRTIKQTLRVKEGETTVLSGIMQTDETGSVSGWPGIPRVMGKRDTSARETELLILITPRLLRLAPRTDRSIYAGSEGGSRPQQ